MPVSCPSCGEFALDGAGDRLLCQACSHVEPANLLPLFVITGAGGSGKSSIVGALRRLLPDCFVVGSDLLIERDRPAYLNRWCRVAYAEAQCGRPTVLAGLIRPGELEAARDYSLTGGVRTLVLDCSDETRAGRLRARKRWSGRPAETLAALISEHLGIAAELRESGAPVIDTSGLTPAQVADEVASQIWPQLAHPGPSIAPAG